MNIILVNLKKGTTSLINFDNVSYLENFGERGIFVSFVENRDILEIDDTFDEIIDKLKKLENK